MKIQKRTISILFAVISVIISGLWQEITAQNSLSSPYSHYGIGNTNVYSGAMLSSIGGVGYAFSRNNTLNLKNPASYSGIDTMSFVFDVGFHADILTLSTSDKRSKGTMGALSHISFAFPVNKHLKFAVGLVPLSDVSYQTSHLVDTMVVVDTIMTKRYYRKNFDGAGGLNKVILGAAYSLDFPKDKLAFGLNMEYLFGNYYRSSALIFYDNTDSILRTNFIDSTLFNSRDQFNYNINVFNFNFGFQYFHTLNNGDRLGIGGSYVLPLELKTDNLRLYRTFTSVSGNDLYKDTIVSQSYKGEITFSQSFGFGLSYEKPQKFFAGADAQFTKWSEFRLQASDDNKFMKDSWNIGIGSEFTPNIYGNYLKQMTYRLGLNYDNGSLFLNNTRINQYSVALGFGLPIRKSSALINLSFEYGIRGTTANNLIRENFFRIGLSLSAKDRWFFKRKYQ